MATYYVDEAAFEIEDGAFDDKTVHVLQASEAWPTTWGSSWRAHQSPRAARCGSTSRGTATTRRRPFLLTGG
jgi:hypothetical protein